MADLLIPISDDVAAGSFTTSLEGEQYLISYFWSDGQSGVDSWYMSISGSRVNLSNLKLVGGTDILAAYGLSGILGSLYVIDTTGANTDPTRNSLGPTKRHRVIYRER